MTRSRGSPAKRPVRRSARRLRLGLLRLARGQRRRCADLEGSRVLCSRLLQFGKLQLQLVEQPGTALRGRDGLRMSIFTVGKNIINHHRILFFINVLKQSIGQRWSRMA
jgi:hypothetical protein